MNSDEFRTFLKNTLPAMGYAWRRFDRRNIRRRIGARAESLGVHEWEKYAQLVARDRSERERLDSLLRLTITRFFRNSWLWPELGSIITDIGTRSSRGKAVQIWSAGCAGGEEPFSMAMLLDELGRSLNFKFNWNILGTDTDPSSLQRSREASYAWGSVREVPPRLLDRWFEKDNGHWILDDDIRKLVTFQEHNLLAMDPPGRFDLVLLRNSVLTYNTDAIQREVLSRIHRCLLSPGYLVIGRTEKVPEGTGFEEISKCIYAAI